MVNILQRQWLARALVFFVIYIHAYAVNLSPIEIVSPVAQRCIQPKKDTWDPDKVDEVVTTLPKFHINEDNVLVTGFSSGADFTIQMQVAYSKSVKGSCAWSGQPYHCGVTRFHDDPLIPYNNDNSFVAWGISPDMCTDCPPEQTIFADHCKGWRGGSPNIVETDTLVNYTQEMAKTGKIDPLSNLLGKKIYLEHGGKDPIYFEVDLRVERHYNLDHALPDHAVANCLTFQWPDLLDVGFGPQPFLEKLRTFNQSEFFDEDVVTGLHSSGYYYAPKECQTATADSACRLVVWACGCGCAGVDKIMQSGFLEWADSARIVLLFPQTGKWASDSCGFKRWQCFDAYGLGGADYALKSGSQMRAVMRMMARVIGTETLG